MTSARAERPSDIASIEPSSHVCWVVADACAYVAGARSVLAEAGRFDEKPVAFGPARSRALAALEPVAALTADPWIDFLGRGPLNPDAMFAMFAEQSRVAREQGYRRLRLVADMDWLLPAQPAPAQIAAFELMLDRRVKELDATIVCAYRTGSYGPDVLGAASCVHPDERGARSPSPFHLTALDPTTWRLSGEVDISVLEQCGWALDGAMACDPCRIDLSDLEFMDVAGMRVLAESTRKGGRVRVEAANPVFRRIWELGQFDRVAPMVQLG